MGYVPQRKTYRLVFEGTYEGLEAVASSATTAQWLDLSDLSEGEFANPPTKADVRRMRKLFTLFGEFLQSWNVEEPDGTPVPATVEGMLSQDPAMVRAVIDAWLEAIGGVSSPLGSPSNGGEQSLVESLPMDILSPSL